MKPAYSTTNKNFKRMTNNVRRIYASNHLLFAYSVASRNLVWSIEISNKPCLFPSSANNNGSLLPYRDCSSRLNFIACRFLNVRMIKTKWSVQGLAWAQGQVVISWFKDKLQKSFLSAITNYNHKSGNSYVRQVRLLVR